MKPKKIETAQDDFFQARLSEILNPRHPLLMMAKSINWSFFEEEFQAPQRRIWTPPQAYSADDRTYDAATHGGAFR